MDDDFQPERDVDHYVRQPSVISSDTHDNTDQLSTWVLHDIDVQHMAVAGTYDGVRLCGELISFVGFGPQETVIRRDPYEFGPFAGFEVAQMLVRITSRVIAGAPRDIGMQPLVRVLRWATDCSLSSIYQCIDHYLGTPFLEGLIVLSLLGFDGAVLRALGLMHRAIRGYHPPWWHSHLDRPRTRLGNFTYITDFPRGLVQMCVSEFGLATGLLPQWNFDRWAEWYRPLLRPPMAQMFQIVVRGNGMNILVTEEGFAILPAHLLRALQTYTSTCHCGIDYTVHNRDPLPCCGFRPGLDGVPVSRIQLLSATHLARVGNVDTVIYLVATYGDLALIYVRGQTDEELGLRSNVSIGNYSAVLPTQFSGNGKIHTSAGHLDVPIWSPEGYTGLLRTVSGAPGMCGTLLTVFSQGANRVVGVNAAVYFQESASDYKVISTQLIALANPTTARTASVAVRRR